MRTARAGLGHTSGARVPTFRPEVTGIDVLAVIGACLVGTGIFGGSILLLVGSLGLTWIWPFVIVISAPMIILPVAWALHHRGWHWKDLGFVRGRISSWHLLWEVPLLWSLAMIIGVTMGTLVGISPSSEAGGARTVADLELTPLLLTALVVVLIFPALEEVVFRRVLYSWVEQKTGPLVATLLSAAAFGMVHTVPAVVLVQFLIGLGAGYLVRRHCSLWAPLALHAFNNAIFVMVVGVFVTGRPG